jgi:hypothetical protein
LFRDRDEVFSMPTTKHRVAVNLSDKEYAELSGLASAHDVSLAWLGRQAILEFMARYRGGEQLQLPLRLKPQRPASDKQASDR